MNISVVIPAYNESGNIRSTVGELFSVTEKIPELKKVEVIVVDDHSSDDTFQAASSMQDPRLSCVRLSRRSGSHTAIRAGIMESTGDAVFCISADGQDNPACLEGMLKKLRAGANVVWVLRKNRRRESWFIRRSAQLFYSVLTLLGGAQQSGIDMSRAMSCLLDRLAADAVNRCSERNTSLFGLIAWIGFRQDFVEQERRERSSGRSKWKITGHLRLAKDWIVGFSGLPLTLIFVAGILVTISGVLYAAYLSWGIIAGCRIAGWSGVMAAVLLLGGVQMVMLGVIGEYLWNNLDEARKRSLFFIEKRSSTHEKGGVR
jgi:dolichol-phosphate mannosyltransferase